MSDIHLTLSNSCFEIDYSAERQSAASASRKEKEYIGKQPDFMYLQKREGRYLSLYSVNIRVYYVVIPRKKRKKMIK